MTVGEMFFFPGMAAYLTDIDPPSRRGEYMGLSRMIMGLAFMVGPWGGMLILARFGGGVLWGTMFLLGAGAALIMARLDEPRHATDVSAVPIEEKLRVES